MKKLIFGLAAALLLSSAPVYAERWIKVSGFDVDSESVVKGRIVGKLWLKTNQDGGYALSHFMFSCRGKTAYNDDSIFVSKEGKVTQIKGIGQMQIPPQSNLEVLLKFVCL